MSEMRLIGGVEVCRTIFASATGYLTFMTGVSVLFPPFHGATVSTGGTVAVPRSGWESFGVGTLQCFPRMVLGQEVLRRPEAAAAAVSDK